MAFFADMAGKSQEEVAVAFNALLSKYQVEEEFFEDGGGHISPFQCGTGKGSMPRISRTCRLR